LIRDPTGGPARLDAVRKSAPARYPPARTGIIPGVPPHGLYDPRHEHDGCGVACIARLDGQPAHETVSRAIEALVNLEHRGAEGADAETGDGAGILVQLPDAFLRAAAREALEIELPAAGRYAVAVCMLAADDEPRRHA
jgi:glutamate synthase (NADPH) large chain